MRVATRPGIQRLGGAGGGTRLFAGVGVRPAPLWEDPFVHLALAGRQTSRIGLGTAVLIPSERSEMAMASAIASIARLSGGRFRACFGTGQTARRTMGRRPITLHALAGYVQTVRGLLAGETVIIDGQPARMLHADGLTGKRPIDVEVWLSAFGPRAVELAERIADGIVGAPVSHSVPSATMFAGSVLDPGESRNSERVRRAVGPWQVVSYHEAYLVGGSDVVDAMPGGRAWREALEELAVPDERHLLSHEGHVTHLTARDLALLEHAGDGMTVCGDADVSGRGWSVSQSAVCRRSSTRRAVRTSHASSALPCSFWRSTELIA